MKKNFKFYTVIWAITLAIFCAVIFLVRPIIPGYIIIYDLRFWISFTLIVAAFAGNLICARYAFKTENLGKMFYNISLVTTSWSAQITMLIASCVLMLIPDCPAWIAAIVCIAIFAFSAVAVAKAAWAADTVSSIDDKIKTRTFFIRSFTVDAESLMRRAKSEAVRAECKKVYEAARYSDPMSREELKPIEGEIRERFSDLEAAVRDDDAGKSAELAKELTALIAERNSKCKLMK